MHETWKIKYLSKHFVWEVVLRGQASWSIQDIVDNLSYWLLKLDIYLYCLFCFIWSDVIKIPFIVKMNHPSLTNYRSLSTREDTLTSRCCLASSGRGRGRGRRELIETFKVLSWRKCSLITVWQTSHQLPRYWREEAWDTRARNGPTRRFHNHGEGSL